MQDQIRAIITAGPFHLPLWLPQPQPKTKRTITSPAPVGTVRIPRIYVKTTLHLRAAVMSRCISILQLLETVIIIYGK